MQPGMVQPGYPPTTQYPGANSAYPPYPPTDTPYPSFPYPGGASNYPASGYTGAYPPYPGTMPLGNIQPVNIQHRYIYIVIKLTYYIAVKIM